LSKLGYGWDMATATLIPDWRLADRIRRAVDFGDVDKQQLADECGVSIKTIYNWISGVSRPRRAALKQISEMSGVSLEWLETGYAGSPDTTTVTHRYLSPQGDDLLQRSAA
jgi:transcriptional regulator with XRE-family HTH domain